VIIRYIRVIRVPMRVPMRVPIKSSL